MQATAAYSLKVGHPSRPMSSPVLPAVRLASFQAEHPLFFYWTEDATAEMDSFRDNGYKCPRNSTERSSWDVHGMLMVMLMVMPFFWGSVFLL